MMLEEKNKSKISDVTYTTEGRNEHGSPDYGIRLAVDYYLPMGRNIYMYAGPSLGLLTGKYKWSRSNDSAEETADYTEFILGARLGAQYMITERFGIFADVGLFYSIIKRDVQEKNASGSVTYDHSYDTSILKTMTSGLGVVFYF